MSNPNAHSFFLRSQATGAATRSTGPATNEISMPDAIKFFKKPGSNETETDQIIASTIPNAMLPKSTL